LIHPLSVGPPDEGRSVQSKSNTANVPNLSNISQVDAPLRNLINDLHRRLLDLLLIAALREWFDRPGASISFSDSTT
jgi:hypothetical protein